MSHLLWHHNFWVCLSLHILLFLLLCKHLCLKWCMDIPKKYCICNTYGGNLLADRNRNCTPYTPKPTLMHHICHFLKDLFLIPGCQKHAVKPGVRRRRRCEPKVIMDRKMAWSKKKNIAWWSKIKKTPCYRQHTENQNII